MRPDDDLWEGLRAMLERLPTVPGSHLAHAHARALALQHGEPRAIPRLRPSAAMVSLVDRALCDVAAELMIPADEPSERAWRLAGLLGAGLPGATVGRVRLAQVHAVTGFFPEHWDFTARWPVPLSQAREQVRHRILAAVEEPAGWEALAWLLISP